MGSSHRFGYAELPENASTVDELTIVHALGHGRICPQYHDEHATTTAECQVSIEYKIQLILLNLDNVSEQYSLAELCPLLLCRVAVLTCSKGGLAECYSLHY